MAQAPYQRLSALDAAFLSLEQDGAHMHVGSVLRLLPEDGLRNEHGGVDITRLRGQLERAVTQIPRLRQRVERVPGFGHPVWVDDPYFQLDYHLRHTSLPRPGSDEQLKRLAGRVFSQRLDRNRPLWEVWVVEGLVDEAFAVVVKIHHCMIDGIGAVSLLQALVAAAVGRGEESAVTPSDPPSRAALWWGEVKHRYEGVQHAVTAAREAWADRKVGKVTGAADITRGLRDVFKTGLTPVSPTSLNPEQISPHRRFETLRLPLDDVKAVKNALGGTINDVVLATVCGALRQHFLRRGESLDEIERFRALLPTNVRKAGQGELGNRVSLMLAPLPLAEGDAVRRMQRVREETHYVKHESAERSGTEFIERLDDQLGLGLVTASFKLAVSLRGFNVVVTNVPGPPVSIPLFGAKLMDMYALVPLFAHQTLGIALFSYAGGLYWGFNADYDALPDLDELVRDTRDSFHDLQRVAGLA